jgi:uncharacterized Ntn-hydrolase superfamily protein
MTFSIVARDLWADEWGVAVQSKFVTVGALVSVNNLERRYKYGNKTS